MSRETDVLPVNYDEIPINKLLARLRHTLARSAPLAVAELANHLPAENQAEFRMPEDPAHIEVIVASPDRGRYYRVTYFAQPTQHPLESDFLTQPPNKIVIQEGTLMSLKSTNPSPQSWEQWQAWSLKSKVAWERFEKKGPDRVEAKVFETLRKAVYQDKQLESGDPTLLALAAAAVDRAFQTTISQVQSLDNIERISWGTLVEEKKPEPPERGGHRVPKAKVELVPVPITIPL